MDVCQSQRGQNHKKSDKHFCDNIEWDDHELAHLVAARLFGPLVVVAKAASPHSFISEITFSEMSTFC